MGKPAASCRDKAAERVKKDPGLFSFNLWDAKRIQGSQEKVKSSVGTPNKQTVLNENPTIRQAKSAPGALNPLARAKSQDPARSHKWWASKRMLKAATDENML